MAATERRARDPQNAVLVAAGPFCAEGLFRTEVAVRGGWLVGVDGGAAHLARLTFLPDIILGDFDSLAPGVRRALAASGARIVPAPDQSLTDLDKALGYCLDELNVRRVRVFGATGGRLDHSCAALAALVKYGRRADIRLVDSIGEAWWVDGTCRLTGPDLPGRRLSLIAFAPVEGVRSTGVRWPLQGEAFGPGLRDGTSNVIVAETVEVSAESGNLFVFLHHPRPDSPLPAGPPRP